MRMLRNIFMLALIILFSFSAISLGADPQDPLDPRWIKSSPWINPKATYLRTCEDNPNHAVILDLNSYNISIGDWVVIRGMGDYLYVPTKSLSGMTCVFSTSTTLLTDEVTRQHRVPDAVSVPNYQAYTLPTWFECIENEGEDPKQLETDIPEDFNIANAEGGGGALVQVPAQYLFVSARERWFSDNVDPDMDYHVEFSDEVTWDQGSEICDNCWDDVHNWDVGVLPTAEVGVTFDQPGNIEVLNAGTNDLIKYLRIVSGGDVEFGINTDITTTFEDPEKYSLLVDYLSSLKLTNGDIFTQRAFIAYKDFGELDVSGGSFTAEVLSTGINAGTKGFIKVSGDGTILKYNIMRIGADLGSGELKIFDGGIVKNIGTSSLVVIGKIGSSDSGVSGQVFVESLGRLSADTIFVAKGGMLLIREGVVEGVVFVQRGGVIYGCNTGIIRGNVSNQGGLLGPGCSTGKLIIDGDYIQEDEGTLEIEVGGYNKGEDYDVLEVTGNVTLNGTLQVNFVNGFAPKQGDVFEFTNITGSVSQNLSKVETSCVASDFQHKTELVGGKLTMTALNDARAIPCGGPKAMPWIPLLLLDD